MKSWLKIACSRMVVVPAIGYCIIVGTLLVAINQGDVLLHGDLTTGTGLKMGMTYMVPYIVSTLSSVGAIKNSVRK